MNVILLLLIGNFRGKCPLNAQPLIDNNKMIIIIKETKLSSKTDNDFSRIQAIRYRSFIILCVSGDSICILLLSVFSLTKVENFGNCGEFV